MFPKRRDGGSSFLISLAIHVAVAVVLVNVITFTVPFRELFERDREEPVERLVYVPLPRPQEAGGGDGRAAAPRGTTRPERDRDARERSAEVPLVAPTTVPTTIPDVSGAAAGRPDGVDGGTGTGQGGRGAVVGAAPGFGDGRLWAPPGMTRDFTPVPKTTAQRVDSTVKATFRAYSDSMLAAAAAAGRRPGDWTTERNGEKWGWDQTGVRLGKFTIPNYLLGLVNTGALQSNAGNMADRGIASGRLREIQENGQRAMSEDEFRAAVKRIRERKERERRDAEAARRARQSRPTSSPSGGNR